MLGATGKKVTMLGLGGAHISGVMDEQTAEKVIEAAIEGGIRFFDTAESYNKGLSEERFGKFLTPKYRDIIFLMTKTHARNGAQVHERLDASLKRLNTDYIDLWQVHGVQSAEDIDKRIGGGVLDELLKLKEKGKIRHIGFTGHFDYNAHKYMLEQTSEFDVCQMPINCHDPNYKSFILNVLPTLVDRNIGIIAMKTLANGGFFGSTQHMKNGPEPRIVPGTASIQEALHFVWSLPVSVALTGVHDVEMLNEKIALAKSFTKVSEEDRTELITRVGTAGFEGEKVEFYKMKS
jgi:aryl-alcohol dehydrogenase-like predicted oxidoreductase